MEEAVELNIYHTMDCLLQYSSCIREKASGWGHRMRLTPVKPPVFGAVRDGKTGLQPLSPAVDLEFLKFHRITSNYAENLSTDGGIRSFPIMSNKLCL